MLWVGVCNLLRGEAQHAWKEKPSFTSEDKGANGHLACKRLGSQNNMDYKSTRLVARKTLRIYTSLGGLRKRSVGEPLLTF